jgi:acylphosphatase
VPGIRRCRKGTHVPGPARTVHVSIKGRVQGVGYRLWTERKATELGLSGWARNRHDGSVEAVFQGPRASVDAMLEACRRGPSAAVVTDVLIREENAVSLSEFELLGDA